MVKLEEVVDEDYLREQEGPIAGEDDWDTDSDADSDIESTTSSIADEETLLERIYALKDILPPTYRARLANATATTTDWVRSGLLMGGKTLWVVSTSALLLGVPWALAYAEEQQMVEMEREMRMQQSANELLAPGASTSAPGQPQPQAAL